MEVNARRHVHWVRYPLYEPVAYQLNLETDSQQKQRKSSSSMEVAGSGLDNILQRGVLQSRSVRGGAMLCY